MLYELYRRYAEPHRKYHNLAHIFRMFEIAQNREMELTAEQVVAIWFHDAVYDIPAGEKSNEQKSADLVDTFYLHRQFRQKVKGIILATEAVLKPEPVPDLNIEEWQVCGLDLYDLGTMNYYSNLNLIRQEYSCCGAKEWHSGRKAFLSLMLEKQTIIGRPFFASTREMDDWHLRARQHMQNEFGGLADSREDTPPPPWPHTRECHFWSDCHDGFDTPRNCNCGAEKRREAWLEKHAKKLTD